MKREKDTKEIFLGPRKKGKGKAPRLRDETQEKEKNQKYLDEGVGKKGEGKGGIFHLYDRERGGKVAPRGEEGRANDLP